MRAAVIDSPQNEQAQAWWFLDFLVIEHRCAPGMKTVVLDMTLPSILRNVKGMGTFGQRGQAVGS